jgi:hypothetical protein
MSADPASVRRSSTIITTTTRHRPFTARSACTLSLASTKSRSMNSGSTRAASGLASSPQIPEGEKAIRHLRRRGY